MGESRMKKLRDGYVPKAPMAKPKESTYTRTWDDDNKPTMTEGIAYLAISQLADKMQISLEDAKARIYEDFTIVKRKIRVHPKTVAHAAHLAELHQVAPADWIRP